MSISLPFRKYVFFLPLFWSVSFAAFAGAENSTTWSFDFGKGAAAEGYYKVTPETRYDAATGFGWLPTENMPEARDRTVPSRPLNDFIFGREAAVLRVDAPPGAYRMVLEMADAAFGNHVLDVSVNGAGEAFPSLKPGISEEARLTATFQSGSPYLEIRFSSPIQNWVVNSLRLEPASAMEEAMVDIRPLPREVEDLWEDLAAFPGERLVEDFRQNLQQQQPVTETGLKAVDYLRLIAGNVDFFRQHQDERGAIIDPYREEEFQYSTPCYALGGAVLVEHAGRSDLLESAALAMDWAVWSLANRKGATAHEDFYAPVLAHALPLLSRHVEPERAQRWRDQLASFSPWQVYRSPPGGGNWNLVAVSGEYLFHRLGLRDDLSYVEVSLGRQGHVFRSPWGLYLEGPMPYDHFPRLWMADMLAAGYEGRFAEQVDEVLRRAAITSLFIQSPTGELPSGGRSAHHQWNEAQQAVTYEIYARYFRNRGDRELARAFKRGARLALGSMKRWQRPSGELWIVKNRVDPANAHAFEGYSSHSQYNLLAMAMLAIAHHHAVDTEDLPEQWAPSEIGGFLVDLRPGMPHVFANARGSYGQINTAPDGRFNSTGLKRLHQAGFNPQLGPSDGPVADPIYRLPPGSRTSAVVGVAWKDSAGKWHRLAEQRPPTVRAAHISDLSESPDEVSFTIDWEGDLPGVTRVRESYRFIPGGVELMAEIPGYDGPLRWVIPVLADDGERQPEIATAAGEVTVALEGDIRRFKLPGAGRIWLGEDLYPYHSGWARLAFAEYPTGGPIMLRASFDRR